MEHANAIKRSGGGDAAVNNNLVQCQILFMENHYQSNIPSNR